MAQAETRNAGTRARLMAAAAPLPPRDPVFKGTRFVAAATSWLAVPPGEPGGQEVALVGRSNVGKSSLVNALTPSAPAHTSDKVGGVG